MSEPDLARIAELSDLFGTSTDLLIGYRMQNKRREQFLDMLRDLIHDKSAAVDFPALERAAQSFPHDFDIVYRLGKLYSLRGTESRDLHQNTRALELLETACRLIDQNTNEEISQISIRVAMAQVYRTLEKQEKAAELLRQNNPCGVNNAVIGDLYAQLGRKEEALSYLSRAILSSLSDQISIGMGLCNLYDGQGDYAALLEVIDWVETVIRAATLPEHYSYPYKILTAFYVLRSQAYLRLKQPNEARAAMREAFTLARAFDAAPDYAADRLRFVSIDAATAYDDFGSTAIDGVVRTVAEQNEPALTALWEEICHEEV